VLWFAIENNLLRARLPGFLGGIENILLDFDNFGHGETRLLLSSKAGVDCKGIP